MFLEDYDVLCRYWIEHPPIQVMVQAYLGIKPKWRGRAGLPMLP